MRISDKWSAPICFLQELITDIAISDNCFKHIPKFDGFYIYELEGDFIKYVKRT